MDGVNEAVDAVAAAAEAAEAGAGTIAPPPPVADVMKGERKELATVGCCEASMKLSVMVVKSGCWWLAIPGRYMLLVD